jgi:alpha-beta hydrolase superfamily lysophospholipase
MLPESVEHVETPTAQPHYLTQGDRQLFTWHHPAKPNVRRGAGVVLCAPIGSEYICAYRAWRILAERLAGVGFDVFRFDYEGTGDSAGYPEEPDRLQAWLCNIQCVLTEAHRVTGSKEVTLIGLRIGATLALEAAAARGGVARLVLWSPFRSGRSYVRELKAFASISQKDYVTQDGADILAAGYILPAAIARALEGLDLNSLSTAPAPNVLLLEHDNRSPDPAIRQRLECLGSRVQSVRPSGTATMLEQAALSKVPDAAIDAITSWLAAWPSPGRLSASVRENRSANASLADGPHYQERGVRFGPADRLFGILSTPKSVSAAPAVILLNTGIEYRVGPHRLYVPLARELAARGHVVFRYDLGGLGDSAPPPGAAENVVYPDHAVDDAREAIALIRKLAPGRRVILAGLCSGAWHAFCAAKDGLHVDGIVSVNPPLYLRDGGEKTTRNPEYQQIGFYRRAMHDPAKWRRVLRGRSAYRNFVRFAGSYVRWKASSWLGAASRGRLLDGLARDLNFISARGITSLFVFSRGDTGLEYFRIQGEPALRRRHVRNRIRHIVVDGAGHTFSPPAAQQSLREVLIDFAVRLDPSRRSHDMSCKVRQP